MKHRLSFEIVEDMILFFVNNKKVCIGFFSVEFFEWDWEILFPTFIGENGEVYNDFKIRYERHPITLFSLLRDNIDIFASHIRPMKRLDGLNLKSSCEDTK